MGMTPNARTQGHAEWQQSPFYAPVVESVDTPHSKCGAERREGSSPSGSTICSSDGIGIHIRFKIGCRRDCEFESHLEHHGLTLIVQSSLLTKRHGC